MGGESRPWGVAMGPPHKSPTILTVAEARDRELVGEMLEKVAPELLAHMAHPKHAKGDDEVPLPHVCRPANRAPGRGCPRTSAASRVLGLARGAEPRHPSVAWATGQTYPLPGGAFFRDRERRDHAGHQLLQPAGLAEAGRRVVSLVVIECVQSEAVERYLPALAALRIAVFREFPYLYERER